jgi:glycerol-3-phosphate dehydrogenase
MNRQDQLAALRRNPDIDVLIIGGGINGIGTMRDLAFQGVSVLLAEKADFASGASAASSHMLHGGIRYLENGEFRLVREALHERNRMLRNAPHYSKPLPTTIPMFKWFSGILNAPLKFVGLLDKPSERGAIVIKIGLILYDWFTRSNRATPTHTFSMKEQSLKQYPRISPDIVCTATYYDAWMPYPERICLDLIRDTEAFSTRAYAINYLSAGQGEKDVVMLNDELTGETIPIKPRVVINAAGPWIDLVNSDLQQPTRFIGGTKGSHLLLDNPELYEACAGSEIFFENKDGRIVLIFPYMNRVMVGTTDIRIDNPDEAFCTDDEIDYILGMIPRVFPTIKVDRSQIVFTFTGVRPLPSSESSRTGAISRDHSIQTLDADEQHSYPIHSLVGGKWTTWRAFSEQAADVALRDLGMTRTQSTVNLAIGGGKGFPTSDADRNQWLQTLQERTELPGERLSVLLDRYGTYAQEVAAYISAENDQALRHVPDYSMREIQFIAQREKVEHIDDIFHRRTLLAMLGYANAQSVEEVASIVGNARGWSEERIRSEITRIAQILNRQNRVII